MARPSGFAFRLSVLAQKESRAALLPSAYLHRRAHTLDSSLRSEQMFCCTDDWVGARHVVPLLATQALVGIRDPRSRFLASLGMNCLSRQTEGSLAQRKGLSAR